MVTLWAAPKSKAKQLPARAVRCGAAEEKCEAGRIASLRASRRSWLCEMRHTSPFGNLLPMDLRQSTVRGASTTTGVTRIRRSAEDSSQAAGLATAAESRVGSVPAYVWQMYPLRTLPRQSRCRVAARSSRVITSSTDRSSVTNIQLAMDSHLFRCVILDPRSRVSMRQPL
jgi:hypothetical protein